MKFNCKDCINKKCHHHNYGYNNDCYLTSYASDPEKCPKYIASDKLEKDSIVKTAGDL